MSYISLKPQARGANLPKGNPKGYFSGAKCRIDLKPGCKFKFFCCLEVYLKQNDQLDLEVTLEGILWERVP